MDIKYYPDGDKKIIDVTYGEVNELGALVVYSYKAIDLENYKCKILQFADR